MDDDYYNGEYPHGIVGAELIERGGQALPASAARRK